MVVIGILALALTLAQRANSEDAVVPERIVFLGSSSTDGFTYPMLVRQALAEANLPVPVIINAGAGGNTTAQILARVERDVIKHRPTRCFVQPGGNDGSHKTSVEDFTKTLRTILQKLKDQRIATVLMTLNCLPVKDPAKAELIAGYNAAIRTLAAEFQCPIGDVYGVMKAAADKGEVISEPDGGHPNYEGYRLLARAVLDVMGHEKLPVPAVLKVDLMPGIIAEWKILAVPDKKAKALTAEQIKALAPNDDWKALSLPETEAAGQWWTDQARKEGYAVSLKKLAGAAPGYIGYAKVTREKAESAFFNTGAHLKTVWLNGEKIFQSKDWTGYHAGKERIPIKLNAGDNIVVIETGEAFFTSITADDQW